MRVAELSVRHPITTVMAFLAVSLAGLLSLGKLGLELFPNITMPTAAVVTVYPGAGSFETESGITRRVEAAVAELNGVRSVSSSSSEGVSMVTVNFAWGTDMDSAIADIRERMNGLADRLPEGAERPGIFKFNPESIAFMTLSVNSAGGGLDMRRLAEKELKPLVEKIPGVANVDVYGGRQRAVLCRLDLDAISNFGVSIAQVIQVFQYENVSLPAGSLTRDGRYVVMRTIGEFDSVASVGEVLVGYRDRAPIYLRDVAEVELAELPQEEFVRSRGRDGVYLSIRKQPGYNTVRVAEAIRAGLEGARPLLPPSVRVDVQTDQSVAVVESVRGVADAAWQGGILAVLILVLFLRNLRPTLIVAVVIPLSVVSTFAPMEWFGYTLNITSLMGISLGVGMFVDNSIVVLETVYRKLLHGMSPKEAAMAGAAEVGMAVSASTLTSVVVFVPLLFVEGFAGQIFKDLAFTISYSLIVSLVVALTLIPVLCAKFLRPPAGFALDPRHASDPYYELSLADITVRTGNRLVDRISAGIKEGLVRLDDLYERVLAKALDRAWWIVGGAVLLLALSVGSIFLVGMEFVPETDEGRFNVSIETAIGSTFEYTQGKVAEIEAIVQERLGPSLVAMTSAVGRGGGTVGFASSSSNLAAIDVSMVAAAERADSIWEIIRDLERETRSRVSGVELQFATDSLSALANTATGDSTPIVVSMRGDDLDAMRPWAERLRAAVASVPGTRGVDVSYKEGKPELQFRVKRAEASSLGISPFEAGVTLRTAYRGTEVSRYTQAGEEYPVQLILREEDRTDWRKLNSLFFVNRAGARVPLDNVVEIKEGTGPFTIFRKDRTRVVSVTGYLDGTRPLSDVNGDVLEAIAALGSPPPGVKIESEGTAKEMNSSFRDLFGVLLLSMFLVYCVMASQFENLLHPFIIMFSIPFAAIGMVGMLLATGTTFNLVAFIGAILLVGYVVNNGIVLVDYVNVLRRRGLPLRDSLIKGGRTRLKPILMSVGTTLLGLAPLALGIGTGSELRAPMGRAVFGGLLSSTIVTLVLIPAMYWLVERGKEPKERFHAD